MLRLYGALFFGTVGKVESAAQGLPADACAGVPDLQRLIFIDTSGLDALQRLSRTLARENVRLMLCGAADQPARILARSGFDALPGADNVAPDVDTAPARLREAAGAVGAPVVAPD